MLDIICHEVLRDQTDAQAPAFLDVSEMACIAPTAAGCSTRSFEHSPAQSDGFLMRNYGTRHTGWQSDKLQSATFCVCVGMPRCCSGFVWTVVGQAIICSLELRKGKECLMIGVGFC